jgi:hypothetical protein
MGKDAKPRFIRGCYVVPPDKLHLHEPAGECPFKSELRPKDRKPRADKLTSSYEIEKQDLQDDDW